MAKIFNFLSLGNKEEEEKRVLEVFKTFDFGNLKRQGLLNLIGPVPPLYSLCSFYGL